MSLENLIRVCSEAAQSRHSSIVRSFLFVCIASFSAIEVFPDAAGPMRIALILRHAKKENKRAKTSIQRQRIKKRRRESHRGERRYRKSEKKK